MENEKEPANWGEELVQVFCDLCIKNIEAGNRPSTHFNAEGWASLVDDFSKLTGKLYSKLQLKNKWDALKEDWKLWKQLKGKETGIVWDPNKKTIDASNEWWTRRLEPLPSKAKKFRRKGIRPEFEATLDRMFMKTVAIDFEWASLSGEPPQESYNSPKDDTNLIASGDDSSGDIERNKIIAVEKSTTTIDMKHKRSSSSYMTKGRKRKEVGDVEKLSQRIDRLWEAVENRSSATSKRLNTTSVPSITDVMGQLDALPGALPGAEGDIDFGLYLFATRLFMSNEKREMFGAIRKPELKIAWLKNEQSKQPDF